MPHVFDDTRAANYQPRAGFTKTAILVPIGDPEALTTIDAPFGTEVMKGPFYIVASTSGPYAAARAEFEADHVQVGPTTWRKHAGVMAYRADKSCRVETRLADGTLETTVDAEKDDWIVRHAGGEVTVVSPETFEERYERADS